MSEIEERIRRYAHDRAGALTEADAAALMTRAMVRGGGRRLAHHLLNAVAALILVIVVIVGAVVLETQIHWFRQNSHARTARNPLPPIPSEVIRLDDPSVGPGLVIPYRLSDGRALPSRPRWTLPGNRALLLASSSDCSETRIRVVDSATLQDTQSTVLLTGCYDTPVILSTGTVLLAHHDFVNANLTQFRDLGAVSYDWSSGRIVRSYPELSVAFVPGLASPDGAVLYTLNPFVSDTRLDFTDLNTGIRLAHISVSLMQAGLSPGGLALSVDGRTLYVNEGDKLATFDARTGAPGPSVLVSVGAKASTSFLPRWLVPSLDDADAKEGFEPDHGISVDPQGRWVALIGADDVNTAGVWIVDTKTLSVLRHFRAPAGAGGLSFSLDGHLLYLLAGQNVLDVIEPSTGRLVKEFVPIAYNGQFLGIAGVGRN